MPADLRARVIVALPAAGVAVALVVAGGPFLALPLAVLGALAMSELHGLAGGRGAPARLDWLAVAALPVAALGGREALLGALVAGLPLLFAAHALARRGPDALRSVPVSMLGLVWIGVAFGHGVLLREGDHGAGLLIDVMVGTFVGDTAAHLFGSAFGRHRLAPRISPNKTVEGLAAGIVVGTAAVWLVATIWQEWLAPGEALALGLAITLAAPAGDLFESLLKRAAGVKDSGRLFGPHGGVLDRIDALLFAAPAAYYVALAVL
jgi:phosphatidate cytidylyltransferase